jgi:hypothetical protein
LNEQKLFQTVTNLFNFCFFIFGIICCQETARNGRIKNGSTVEPAKHEVGRFSSSSSLSLFSSNSNTLRRYVLQGLPTWTFFTQCIGVAIGISVIIVFGLQHNTAAALGGLFSALFAAAFTVVCYASTHDPNWLLTWPNYWPSVAIGGVLVGFLGCIILLIDASKNNHKLDLESHWLAAVWFFVTGKWALQFLIKGRSTIASVHQAVIIEADRTLLDGGFGSGSGFGFTRVVDDADADMDDDGDFGRTDAGSRKEALR